MITSKKISDNKYGVEGNIVTFKKTDDIYRLSNDIKNKSVYFSFDDIIGESNEIKNIIELAKRISKTNASVLIKGESGTGKEVFAQAIHSYSNRSKNHFVPINCGAIPADLIESELFGYEPGSFTGGLKNGKIGKLEHASGGTIFFDEIDSMPINLQIKLLRALSSKKITRIGGKDEIDIDIRIISATKKDLFYEIKNECFREDFYYRINTILLEIPPLRERNKDICILTKYFVKYYEKIYNVKIRKITKDYIKALEKYYFNGNVRELRHIIERSVILAKNYILDINVLPQQIFDNKSKNNILEYNNPNKQSVLDLHEKELIKKVLEKENYNISSSSRILGISRPTLYNKIKEYDISVK